MSTPEPADAWTTGSRGRHPVNVGHLVMGLAFLGLVGVWGLISSEAVGGDDVRWLLPVPWVLAGLAGLLATTLSGRRGREDRLRHGPRPETEQARRETTGIPETTETTETTEEPR